MIIEIYERVTEFIYRLAMNIGASIEAWGFNKLYDRRINDYDLMGSDDRYYRSPQDRYARPLSDDVAR